MPSAATDNLSWSDEPLQDAWPTRYINWETLATRYAHPEVVSAEFVDAVVRTLARNQTTLRLLTCSQNSQPVFMAIGQLVNFYTFSLFQPSQTPVALVLAKDGVALRELSQKYIRTKFLTVFRFEIFQVDSKHYEWSETTSTVVKFEHIQVPYVDFPACYEDYFLTLSKNFRANCRKQRNKLEALGITSRFAIVSEPSEIDQALDMYSELEVNGWKLRKGTAVDESTGQLEFYRTLLKSYANSGRTHIAQLWVIENEVERLVASDLCIIRAKTAFMLKTAYDESLRDHETLSSLTPAALMHEELFRHWIDNCGIARLEFYGKTLDWHLRWTDQQRPLYHLSIFRSKLARSIFFGIKDLLKRFLILRGT
jgi:Acetyltransferase (GNAT) domain